MPCSVHLKSTTYVGMLTSWDRVRATMRLFRAKVDIQLTVDKPAYAPGDVVRAAIDVVPEKELELEEGRVELVYENEYRYRTRDWDSNRNVSQTTTRTATDRTVYDTQRFVEAGSL